MKKSLLFTLAGAMLLLSACGHIPTPTPDPEPTPTPSITEYSFSFIGTHCTCNNETKYEEGKSVLLMITTDKGYKLPDSITVSGSEYTYNNKTGKIVLTIKGDTTIKCEAVEVQPILYVSKIKENDGMNTFSYNEKEDNIIVEYHHENDYYTVSHIYTFKDGNLIEYNASTTYTDGTVYSSFVTYEYENGLLVKTLFTETGEPDETELYEYDSSDRLTKFTMYSDNEIIKEKMYDYIDENTVEEITKYYFSDEIDIDKRKTITEIDEEKGIKTVSIYKAEDENSAYELDEYEVRDLNTNHLYEYVDILGESKYLYSYNEQGYILSLEKKYLNDDLNEYINYSISNYEYNENNFIESSRVYHYNPSTEAYDILNDEFIFTTDENGTVTKYIYNSYDGEEITYTTSEEYEFISLSYDLDIEYTNIKKAATISDYYDFLLGL